MTGTPKCPRLVLQRIDDRFPALKIVIELFESITKEPKELEVVPNSAQSKSLVTEDALIPKIVKRKNRGLKKRKMKMHKNTDVKQRTCKQCGLVVQRKRYLKIHVLVHSGNRPYECDDCGKRFIHKYNLRAHIHTHMGERPHKCIVCARTFLYSSNLKYHMRTHTGECPHTCKTCGKGFLQSSDLKVHSYVHSDTRPHKCKSCGKRFRQISHVITHSRLSHGS